MFKSIKRQLFKFYNRPDIFLKFEEQEAKNNWQDIVGNINKKARGKSQALYITEYGELVVGVTNTAWLQELSFYKKDIQKYLNERRRSKIKSVRFIIT